MLRTLTRLPRDEAAMVVAARGGDRVAFGLLYRRYARMVHGILLARVPPGEVDDLVQDVFLAALRQLGALRDAGAFGPWLAAIARNRARDHYRGAAGFSELPSDLAAPAPATLDVEALALLRWIVRTLPEAYRETVILRLVEGMTGPEIAARTGLTPESVRVNLCRGMRKLREQMERTEP